MPCARSTVGRASTSPSRVTGRVEATHGDVGRTFAWASVTKLATAVAMLVAAEEGLVDLDEPAGPPGSTFRHLLAHASGLPFEPGAPIARPGARRIYSNYGFEVAADARRSERAEMPFAEYFAHVWAGHRHAARGLGRRRASRGRSPTCSRSRASCRRRRGSRPRRSRRRRRCSSRGSPACCPASAGRSRTTGGSASSCATASRRTGRARGTRRDVRPLRPQRHVPLGRPRRGDRARAA